MLESYELSSFSVLQNNRTGEGSGTGAHESKSISIELATAINDGLVFYEQVEEPAFLSLLLSPFLLTSYVSNLRCLMF